MVDMKTEKGRREKAPLYKDGESVKGAVTIRPKDGKRLEHTGIKVQFIGTIGTLGRKPHYNPTRGKKHELMNIYRNVLRSRKPLRIPLSRPRTRRPRRSPTSPNLRFQLQKHRKAIRVLQRYQCAPPLLRAGHRVPTNGGCHQRKGYLGLLVPDTARDE